MLKTEYLITLDTKNNVATDTQSFINLLMCNPNIKFNEDDILYFSEKYNYTIQPNQITNTIFICYHITIECDIEDFDLTNHKLKMYQDLLKDIRFILFKCTDNIEILWDDISFNCSQKAYPTIYEIENLMRKLLTKFMLINVGAKWEKENIPSKISKSRNKDKDINLGNGLLYQLDFIELSTFLFESYSLNPNINDLKKKVENKENISFSLMNDFIARSNWERYFSTFVNVENEHLKKQWDSLYTLRCKIAHNNMFTITDLNSVETIVTDLKPSILQALNELDSIKVDANDKERVSESFAQTTNEKLGEFIISFNLLEKAVTDYYILKTNESDNNIINKIFLSKTLTKLYQLNIIDNNIYKDLQLIINTRNGLVHHAPQTHHFSDEEISAVIKSINHYISYFDEENLK